MHILILTETLKIQKKERWEREARKKKGGRRRRKKKGGRKAGKKEGRKDRRKEQRKEGSLGSDFPKSRKERKNTESKSRWDK